MQTSPITRTALWSAENLTAQAVPAARTVPRNSEFYVEAEIPAADRARLLTTAVAPAWIEATSLPRVTFSTRHRKPKASVWPTSFRRYRPAIAGCGATSRRRRGAWYGTTVKHSW